MLDGEMFDDDGMLDGIEINDGEVTFDEDQSLQDMLSSLGLTDDEIECVAGGFTMSDFGDDDFLLDRLAACDLTMEEVLTR